MPLFTNLVNTSRLPTDTRSCVLPLPLQAGFGRLGWPKPPGPTGEPTVHDPRWRPLVMVVTAMMRRHQASCDLARHKAAGIPETIWDGRTLYHPFGTVDSTCFRGSHATSDSIQTWLGPRPIFTMCCHDFVGRNRSSHRNFQPVSHFLAGTSTASGEYFNSPTPRLESASEYTFTQATDVFHLIWSWTTRDQSQRPVGAQLDYLPTTINAQATH